jgi:FixJ family two-component response regulator
MDRKLAVYIVDDDPAILRALKALAEAMGLDAQGYDSAEAFLERYQPDRPGCLILDMNLPGMNGLELQTELKNRSLALPVIFITGHGVERIEAQAIGSGAIAVLEKPFRIGQLSEAIQKAVGLVGEL